jgi:hypothetical protein
MEREEIDWIGRWYVVASERGVNQQNTLGRANVASGKVDWFFFNHSEMDGAGGMTIFLRQLGLTVPSLPKGRVAYPGWWTIPGILWRAYRQMGPSRVAWREANPRSIPPATAVPWIAFTRAETDQLVRYARDRGLSENSFLLSLLCQEILPELLETGGHGRILFPVNMRGAVRRNNPLANQSSAIFVDASPHSTAEDLHLQLKRRFLAGEHWGVWWAFSIGRWIGLDAMRRISRRSEQRSFFLGTFSNMGAWPPPDADDPRPLDEQEILFAAAPGTPNYPIGMVCTTWYGKLAITLKIDPTVCADRSKPERLLRRVKEQVLRSIKGLE